MMCKSYSNFVKFCLDLNFDPTDISQQVIHEILHEYYIPHELFTLLVRDKAVSHELFLFFCRR